MTFPFRITVEEYKHMADKLKHVRLTHLGIVRQCLDNLFEDYISGATIPKIQGQLKTDRIMLITVGLSKERWNKLLQLSTALNINKTQVLYTALLNHFTPIIKSFDGPIK